MVQIAVGFIGGLARAGDDVLQVEGVHLAKILFDHFTILIERTGSLSYTNLKAIKYTRSAENNPLHMQFNG